MAGRGASLRPTSQQTGQKGPCFHEPGCSPPTHSCFQFALPGSPWKLLHPVPGRRRGSPTCSTWLGGGKEAATLQSFLFPWLCHSCGYLPGFPHLGKGPDKPMGKQSAALGYGPSQVGSWGRWGLCVTGQTLPGHTSPDHSVSISFTALPPTPCLIKLHTCPPSNIWSNEKGKKTI